jgi:hypothetical protein
MVEHAPQFKPGDHVRIVASDPRNIIVDGRLGWLMSAVVHRVDGTWAYWVDLLATA